MCARELKLRGSTQPPKLIFLAEAVEFSLGIYLEEAVESPLIVSAAPQNHGSLQWCYWKGSWDLGFHWMGRQCSASKPHSGSPDNYISEILLNVEL